MKRRRLGYSLTELLIVVVMIGLITMMAIPKFRIVRDQNSVSGARARIESSIAAARASAIHKGRLSLFYISDPWVSVWTLNPTSGFWDQQVPWTNMSQVFPGTRLEVSGAGWHYMYFEPRGVTWASARPSANLVFRVIGQTTRDSVCVTRMGQILPKGCIL